MDNYERELCPIYDRQGNIVAEVKEEELENYFFCEECGKWYEEDAIVEILNWRGNNTEKFVCEDCAIENSDYQKCEDCGEWHYIDDMIYVRDHGYVCDSCGQNYSYCDACGEYYDSDYVHYSENRDAYYCDNCYPEECENGIYDYHEFNNWQFYKLENENPPYYIGFENEIEPGEYGSNSEVPYIIQNAINAVCMHDGSLDYGGIEIVSHPQSYNYIMEHKQDYIDLFNRLRNDYKYISHNSNNCGLHFHVSRPDNEEVVNRVWHILETYKQELIIFSRRKSNQLEHWAKFLSDDYIADAQIKLKSLNYIDEHKERHNRYMALNLTNANTIEFRFMRGTLKPETFLASVELINNIMKYCSNLEIPLEEITWEKLTGTEYCKQYCEELALRTMKTPKDLTNLLDKFLEEQKQLLDKAKKIVDNISKRTLKELNEYVSKDTQLLKSNSIQMLDNKVTSIVRVIRDKQNTIDTLYQVVRNSEHMINNAYQIEHYYNGISKYYTTRLVNIAKQLKNLKENLTKEVI